VSGGRAAIVQDAEWQSALEGALQATTGDGGSGPTDLAFLFASASYGESLDTLVQRARSTTGATALIGCSGLGIIGPGREIEGAPAVSLLTLCLPGATLRAVRFTQSVIEGLHEADDWRRAIGAPPEEVKAWFIFADPFSLDAERLVSGLSEAYPGRPFVGGLASGHLQSPRTYVFLDDQVYGDGAVAVALGGPYRVETVVSQGAEPISQPWTITGVRGHVVDSIAQRPAFEVLLEALKELPPETQRRAQSNLLVGLAMDEYRDEFGRGDFLIRNLAGIDPKSGALAIGAHPRVGQTIQFQLRDARAADEELQELLARAKEGLADREPLGAILCSCTGRGAGLFGQPNHDARAVSEQLGVDSLAGFFCNGEIGPVRGRNFLHGYTASIALIVADD
jgi:small ligand-binding sensory domain FIST